MDIEKITVEICGNKAIITSPSHNGSQHKKTLKVDTLVKAFQEQGTGIQSPLLPLGTIKYKEKGNSAILIIYSPPAKFNAQYQSDTFENCIRPGLVMRFNLGVRDNTYNLIDTYVWAVKEAPLFLNENTPLYALPFPNINDKGWVCWGGTNTLAGSLRSLMGLPVYIDRLFGAPFNNDLFQGALFRHAGFDTPRGLFEFLKDKEEFPESLYVDAGYNTKLGGI
jgi:hypothetical protein